MKQELVIQKVNEKLGEINDKKMDLSTDLAEDEHHKECKLDCCGCHEVGDNGKCKECGMTEDQIDDHNLEWWHCVDYIEETNEQFQDYLEIENKLEAFLEKQNV